MIDLDSSEGVVTVELTAESKSLDELEAFTETVRDNGDCDVVLDFGSVEVINSPGIMRLLDLRDVVTEHEHHLVLSGVSEQIKGIFAATGLESVFEFSDGDTTA